MSLPPDMMRKTKISPRLIRIIKFLERHPHGSSNAEIDSFLNNNSQWVTMDSLRELAETGFVEYKPELFGEPGRYSLTKYGREFLSTRPQNASV